MNRTTVERKSDREVVVTRTFDAPARLVFEAWTKPELFKQWWVPRSMGMVRGGLAAVAGDGREATLTLTRRGRFLGGGVTAELLA